MFNIFDENELVPGLDSIEKSFYSYEAEYQMLPSFDQEINAVVE